MKKVIVGSLMVFACPFVIILGSKLMLSLEPSSNTQRFAGIVGGVGILFNLIMGIALVIKGHQDNETFKGW